LRFAVEGEALTPPNRLLPTPLDVSSGLLGALSFTFAPTVRPVRAEPFVLTDPTEGVVDFGAEVEPASGGVDLGVDFVGLPFVVPSPGLREDVIETRDRTEAVEAAEPRGTAFLERVEVAREA
jgi:hypothetical protein